MVANLSIRKTQRDEEKIRLERYKLHYPLLYPIAVEDRS